MAMEDLEHLFVQAAQSEQIKLVISEDELTIPKGLISNASQRIAQLIERGGGVLNFCNQPPAAVRMFVFWCHQNRLPPIEDSADLKARHQRKRKLIDLWMFCGDFDVRKVQNKAMEELIALLTVPKPIPHLIKEDNIRYIWDRSAEGETALKSLAVYALIAQIEEGTGAKTTEVEALAQFVEHPQHAPLAGFTVMLYKAHQEWTEFEMPKSPKKGKAKTKWALFAASDDVKAALVVSERAWPVTTAKVTPTKTTNVQEITAAVKEASLAPKESATDTTHGEVQATPPQTNTPACNENAPASGPASAVKVKREAPDDGEEEGSPSKKAKPFKKGEVIDLTIE